MNRCKYRKLSGSVPSSAGSWQMVYTGFILILLCFFIMLTSFASLQQSKITQFVKSFSTAVTVFSGGRALEPGETMISSDAMIVDKENQLALLFEKVNTLSKEAGLENINIRCSQKGVMITLADRMLFSSGDARICASSYPLLDKITSMIEKAGHPVEIEGHTDDIPINTADYASNWELSTARAVNVLRYMIENRNVDNHLLSAVGRSQYDPMVPNSSVVNRNQNRRVEIIFKPE